MTQQSAHGPETIMALFQGLHATAVLAAGIDVGIFGALASGASNAEAVSERIRCPVRTTRMLLDALTVVGLVEAEGAAYKLTPVAADHLTPGKPMYMGDVAGIFANPVMWSAMGRLGESVRAGGAVTEKPVDTPSHPFWLQFAKSSAAFAFPAAMALDGLLGDHLAGKPKARVLDVACGSGIYGYTLAKRPNVELTSLDWPKVLDETRVWAGRMGVDASRVKYLPGNLFEVDYGGPYDVIVLSHVFHHFDSPTCASLMRKVASALAPGGRVAIHDFLADESSGKMFSMVMLGTTSKGESFAKKDYFGWFDQAGLKAPEMHPSVGMPTAFLVATKP